MLNIESFFFFYKAQIFFMYQLKCIKSDIGWYRNNNQTPVRQLQVEKVHITSEIIKYNFHSYFQ